MKFPCSPAKAGVRRAGRYGSRPAWGYKGLMLSKILIANRGDIEVVVGGVIWRETMRRQPNE